MVFKFLPFLFFIALTSKAGNSISTGYSSIYSEKIVVKTDGTGFTSDILIRTNSTKNTDAYFLFYDSFKKISSVKLDVWNEQKKKFKNKEIIEDDYSSKTELFQSTSRTKQITVPKGQPFILRYTEQNSEMMLLGNLMFVCQCPVDTFYFEILIPEGKNISYKIRNSESLKFFKIDSVAGTDGIRYFFTGVSGTRIREKESIIHTPPCFIEMIVVPAGLKNQEYKYFNDWYLSKVKEVPSLNDDSKKEIDSVTAGTNSPDSITVKLFDYIRDKIKYIDIETGYGCFIPRDPNQILKLKMGDCKDKSNLLRQALAYKGISSRLVITTTVNQDNVTDFPSICDANHVLLIIDVPGKEPLFADPTEETCKLGYTGLMTQGKPSFAFDESGGKWIKIPFIPASDNTEICKIFLKQNGDSITGNMSVILHGLPADFYKNLLKGLRDEEKSTLVKMFMNFSNRNLITSNIKFNAEVDSFMITANIILNSHQIFRIDSSDYVSLDFLPRPLNLPNEDPIPNDLELFFAFTKKVETRIQFEKNINNLRSKPADFKNDIFDFNLSILTSEDELIINYDFTIDTPVIPKEESQSCKEFRNFISKTFSNAIKFSTL